MTHNNTGRAPARLLAVAGALMVGTILSAGAALAQVTPVPIEKGQNDLFASRVLTTGLSNPWEISWGPNDMIWVTERSTGEVTLVDPQTGAQQTILTLDDFSVDVQHQGLLGMAFHPELLKGTGNDFVYLAYTYDPGDAARPGPRQRLVRYTYDETNNQLVDPVELISGIPAGNDHNAGRVKIGPDLKIYYTLGEQGANFGGNYQRPNHAQLLPTQEQVDAKDWTAYSGKVLRLDLDGSIPEDNPEIEGVRSHIFTYGHRNPQGIDFGPDGTIYVAEHGPDTDDELNVLEPGGNYGWPNVAGFRDDKAYVYGNWSEAPKSLRYTGRDIPPEVPQYPETEFDKQIVEPIATYWTVESDYDFAGGCGWICNPTIAPGSVQYYAAGDSGISEWDNSVLMPTLKHGTLYVQHLTEDGKHVDGLPTAWFRTQNRYRDLTIAPDNTTVFIATDGFGTASEIYGETGFTNVLHNPGAILVFTYGAGGEGGTILAPPEQPAGGDRLAEQGPPEVQGDALAGGEADPGTPPGEEPTGDDDTSAAPSDESADAQSSGDSGALDTAALMAQGETLFRTACTACHGAAGQGAQGPALAGNQDLADAAYVARTLVHGFGYMPPFGARFDDEDLASIATYIRNSWGNEFGDVQPADVAEQR